MVVGGRAATLLPLNLPHLQNLIKRDATSYRSEFLLQNTHFYSILGLLQTSGWDVSIAGGENGLEGFENLVTFMSHVVPYFQSKQPSKDSDGEENYASKYVSTLMETLERDGPSLPPSLRRCMVQALALLRSKKALVNTEKMLTLFFRLFQIRDRPLRSLLYDSIVADVRRANHPTRNNALNRTLQNFMYSIFTSNTDSKAVTVQVDSIAATKSLQVIIELYRRGIWNDAKTVNLIAQAALKANCTKVMMMGLNFFLGKFPGASDMGAEDDESVQTVNDAKSESAKKAAFAAGEEYRSLLHACSVGGHSKAKTNKMKRMKKKQAKAAIASNSDELTGPVNFSPIQLVNDPQGFAEKLYRNLKTSNEAFETKLLMMNVLSRFIGYHQLLVLDFYSFLLRYLQPHQRQVTQVLAYTAQASHPLIPPDALYPVLKAVADNFVADHSPAPVIAAGLNGIREICTRSPLCMTETLLQDLTGYKKGGDHKNKGVMMAARSLITLFRELNPELLHRKDRGKDITIGMMEGKVKGAKAFGQEDVVDGEEILKKEAEKEAEVEAEVESDDDEEDEEVDDDDDDDDEWESVDGEGEELDFDDFEEVDEDDEESDDEEEEAAPAKKVKFDLPTDKLLLPEDFEKQKKGEDESSDDSNSDSDSEDLDPSVVPLKSIEGYKPKAKADYEARMASIQAGREGREKFGTRKRGNARSSTTNKEKSKAKNFLMMAHKTEVRGKKQRSLKQRQAVLKKHKGNMKKNRRR